MSSPPPHLFENLSGGSTTPCPPHTHTHTHTNTHPAESGGVHYVTPFILFDIKCKILNLMSKTCGSVFLGHLAGWVFKIQFKPYVTSKMELMDGNC